MSQGEVGTTEGFLSQGERRGRMQGLQCCGNAEGWVV